MGKKSNTQEFAEKAKTVHGDKYDYSLVDYKCNASNVIIICKKHGEFLQRPANHLNGANCIKCTREINTKEKLRTKDKFIEACRKTHGNTYDYSITNYTNCKDKVKVTCKIHGIFELIADNHQRKDGCPNCRKEKSVIERKESFIKRAKEIHGDKYDYSKVDYINNNTKIDIICQTHGAFSQLPLNHLQGNGCNKCNLKKKKDGEINTMKFINLSNEIHNYTYLYNNTVYIDKKTSVLIECKYHGIFKQLPSKHLKGNKCQKCASKEGGKKIRNTTEGFIRTATEIHGDRYDYTITNYKHSRLEVEIGCRIHGTFNQTPSTHLKGSGCQKCAKLINVYKREDYIKLSKKAILYLVLLEYNGEKFYKIGKTKNTTHERLSNNIGVYKYSIVNEYLSDSGTIFDLEIELHNKYNKHSYKPSFTFAGYTECYSLDLPINEIIKFKDK